MIDGVDIPNLPGFARRIGNILIVPVDEVRQFQPSPSGRVRARAPSWRAYRSRGSLLLTDIRVPVRVGQEVQLLDKLEAIQKSDRHTFPGTVARYVVKADEVPTSVQILLVWKSTEMPSETKRAEDLALFQADLADVLDWEEAQWDTNEVIIHT